MDFASGISGAAGISLDASAASLTLWNTFRDVFINFEKLESGTIGILALGGSGLPVGSVLWSPWVRSLRLLLATKGNITFAELDLERLRFYLSAEKQVLMNQIRARGR